MTTRRIFANVAVIFLLSLMGCITAKKITSTLIIPDYDFSPPSSVASGSAGIKVGLIEPNYDGNFIYSNKSPFGQFRKSMGSDFEEILTSRGFTIKGPFEAYDLMTYSDKTECELGLDINIDLNIIETSGGWDHIPPQTNPYAMRRGNYSRYGGTLNLSGKITIAVIETFTRQKLLVKSIPVPQENIVVQAEADYNFNSIGVPLEDPGVHNPIAAALSNFYKSTMKRGYDMLSKEELAHVQTQVAEIREKAGFIKR
ncbi:MAG: hypothetical protein IPJ51_11805 [Saprospiraceae bacterium]|nr:hypothetical protein [Saprospiraceae bacterium]